MIGCALSFASKVLRRQLSQDSRIILQRFRLLLHSSCRSAGQVKGWKRKRPVAWGGLEFAAAS